MIAPLYLPVHRVMLQFLQVILYMTYSTSTFTMGHQKRDHTSTTWSVTTTSTTSHIMKQVNMHADGHNILVGSPILRLAGDHNILVGSPILRLAGDHKFRNIPRLKVYDNHV
jgi:hypothetical protein